MVIDRAARIWRFAAAIGLLIFAAACDPTPSNLVVLLPESDGTVGQVTVKNDAGTVTLGSAGAATGIASSGTAPSEAFRVEDDKVSSLFRTAIEAQPDPPVSFILYFFSDKTRMTRASQAQWPKILAEIRRRKTPDIGIVGHTDRAGPAAYNEPLSRRRARIIRRRLIKEGVDPNVIDISWHGEKNPIVPTPDGVRERRNRRVEIIVR